MKTTLLLIFGVTLLASCTHMNEEFDCPAGKGHGNGLACQSITEVKKKLNQGEIDLPETTTEAYQRRGGSQVFLPPVLSQTPVQGSIKPISFMDSHGMVIHRTPEKSLRIWIAPYQDCDGNLREASVIHTVIQGGTWQLSPSTHS